MQPLSVASQAAPTGPARALDIEEKADTLRHVKEALGLPSRSGVGTVNSTQLNSHKEIALLFSFLSLHWLRSTRDPRR